MSHHDTHSFYLPFSEEIDKSILPKLAELHIKYLEHTQQFVSLLINEQKITLSDRECIKIESSFYCLAIIKKDEKTITFSVNVLFAFPTYIRDVDMEIMSHLNAAVLQALCISERYLYQIGDDNSFWRLKLSQVFGYELPHVAKRERDYRIIFRDLIKTKLDHDDLLAIAAKYALTEVVTSLLDRGIVYIRYYNAVRLATEAGHLGTVTYLVDRLTTPRYLATYDLCIAARNGHTHIVAYLIQKIAPFPLNTDMALKMSAENGHTSTIAYLIEHGANIHIDNGEIFCLAAKNGHTNILVYLIEHVVDNAAYNAAALQAALENDRFETADYLFEHGGYISNYDDILYIAAREGKTSRVTYLINRGANIHALEDGALPTAAQEGHIDTALLLLNLGAEVRARGDEAIRFAVKVRNIEITRLLLSYYPSDAAIISLNLPKYYIGELLGKEEEKNK